MDMRDQKFGIEIEMTGITRKMAASVIAAYFSKQVLSESVSYDRVIFDQGSHYRRSDLEAFRGRFLKLE